MICWDRFLTAKRKRKQKTTAEETPEVTPEDNDASDIMDLEGTSAEDEEFLKQFEQELAGTSQDDLMQQFEQELGADQGNKEEAVSDDTQALINDLDDILNGDSDGGFEEPTPDAVEEPEIQAEAEDRRRQRNRRSRQRRRHRRVPMKI